MNTLFEYTDKLNNPYECFTFDAHKETFPVRPHWHYFAEVMYVFEGDAIVSCNDETSLVGTDELFIFPPSSVHSIYASQYGPLKYHVIKFDLSQLNAVIHSTEAGNVRFSFLSPNQFSGRNKDLLFSFRENTGIGESNEIRRIFEDCIKEMDEKNIGYQSVIRTRLADLMIYLLRIRVRDGFNPSGQTVSLSSSLDISTITEYIDAHLGEDLRVEDLAKQCNMSYSYFAKCFHEFYGQSCKHYISFLRLCKAENMLLFTDYDLTYISQEAGFSDCSHLIHAFKEKYGETPHQFRKRH